MLIKNSIRAVIRKPIQTLSLILFMILTTFIYVTLEGAISSVEYFLDDFTEYTNQEDFFIVLSTPTEADIRSMLESQGLNVDNVRNQSKNQLLSAHDLTLVDFYDYLIGRITEEFNVNLEGRFYRDIVETFGDQAHTFRLVQQTNSINLTYVLAGQLPTSNNEIALFQEYANQNGLMLGDTLKIQDKEYVITAFIALPDYIYPIFSFDSPLFNPQTQTIIMTTDETYASFTERELVLFSGYFNGDVDQTAMINEISNFPGVSYALGNEMNIRISTLDFHLSGNRILAITFSNLMLLMCVVMVMLILKKRINSDRIQIGVLKAMGYSHLKIIGSYLIYPLFAALMGSSIGFFLGIGSARLLANYYVVNFVLPPIQFYFTPRLLVRGMGYPILMTVGASFVISHYLLNGGTISLMQENTHLKLSKISKSLAFLLKPFSFRTRFKYSLAFRNLGKILSLFFIVLMASVFLTFGFIAFNAVDQVAYRAFSRANYHYEVKFNRFIQDEIGDNETEFLKVQVSPNLENIVVPFFVYGIDPENDINPLYNAEGKNITSLSTEGLIINEFIARAYSLNIGDELTMEAKGRKISFEIKEIVDHFNGAMMYTSLENLRQELSLRKNDFNGLWTNQRPETSPFISYIFSMTDLEQNVEIGMEMIRVSLQFMVVVAVLIGSIMMITVTNFIIDENQKQISILKVMGYCDREISKMVLTIYFPFVIAAYFLGVSITRWGIDLIMGEIAARLPMAIPTDFNMIHLLGGAVIVVCTYLIAVKFSKIQLNKVSLQEVLKY